MELRKKKIYYEAASKRLQNTKEIKDEYLDVVQNNKSKPRIPFGSLIELGVIKPGVEIYDKKKRFMQKLWLMEV